MDVPKTLLVTNDYPPRVGGIQRTLEALVRRFPPDRIAVVCPAFEGAAAFDEAAPYPVFRRASSFLWPTPPVARAVRDAIDRSGAEVVLFGATYPLGLLGPGLAKAGIPYLSAAHGFEYWLSIAPGSHRGHAPRHVAGRARAGDVLARSSLASSGPPSPSGVPVSVMYPGADISAFRPDLPFDDLRARHGVTGRPLVVCVSRLVPRKGQDVLIRAMPRIRRRVPDAALLIVGGGPYRGRLDAMAAEAPAGSVVFAGQVSEEDLPRYYRAGDVFAMPCRDRRGGLEVEGWGNVFIEAAACARPVVVGDSGGARESLVDGETGLLVDGADVGAVADAVASLLEDPARAEAMGRAGRERVERAFTWDRAAEQLAGWLRGAAR